MDGEISSSEAAGDGESAAGIGLETRIGRYRVVGKLGEGGMGVVLEAEQESSRRRVALKVVRGGVLGDDVQVRMFLREAEMLARLEHPSIAAIYEARRTAGGQHFFAMELVRGRTLDRWLEERPERPDRREIERRLALFLPVCDAVQYAHQRGVIHRDLKPSNLVVVDAEHGFGRDRGGRRGEGAGLRPRARRGRGNRGREPRHRGRDDQGHARRT